MKRLTFRTDGRSGQHVASNADWHVVITWLGDRFEVEVTPSGSYDPCRYFYRRTYRAAVAAAVRSTS